MYPKLWKPLVIGVGALLPLLGMTALVGAQGQAGKRQTPGGKPKTATTKPAAAKPPASPAAANASAAIPAEQLAFFEKKIRPVLSASCYGCHSGESKAGYGGLFLDTRDALRRGGDSGPAIVPRDPDRSPLIQAISYHGRRKMPPTGKLSDTVIADFTEWVGKDGRTRPACSRDRRRPDARD
jgi:hypothetical protein